MKILALERELKPIAADQHQALLQDEAREVWRLQQENIIREIYFDARNHTAVILLEREDLQEAEEILKCLPLVDAGLIEFEMIPLKPYDGFARLFMPLD